MEGSGREKTILLGDKNRHSDPQVLRLSGRGERKFRNGKSLETLNYATSFVFVQIRRYMISMRLK